MLYFSFVNPAKETLDCILILRYTYTLFAPSQLLCCGFHYLTNLYAVEMGVELNKQIVTKNPSLSFQQHQS